jgi:hypothetical protein
VIERYWWIMLQLPVIIVEVLGYSGASEDGDDERLGPDECENLQD